MTDIHSAASAFRAGLAAFRPGSQQHELRVTAALGVLLLALIAAGARGLPAPLAAVRLLLSLWFLLFAPGYALQAAIFPRACETPDAMPENPDRLERLALSFGLSLAADAGIGLLLDRLPWGIRLWPIVVAEGVVIGAGLAVARYRRQRLPLEQQPGPARAFHPRAWWQRQGRRDRILYGILALALLMGVTAAGSILASGRPNAHFSEFYILGREGRAESYPYRLVLGQPVSVTLGIANREGVSATYRAEVRNRATLVATVNDLRLQPGEAREVPVQFAPLEAGEDVPVTFLLYRDGSRTPYRSLRLWLKVQATP